ncbi:MAG: DoxX family protein [Flavobacterium sp.]|uniref:DoxX family protein n=1 Tax=Flavobacterium sp. TaxID=239 RepID=UPI0011F7C81D|nr:DoxX family protein [Flavobacterium sp.]RZJ64560.1 MAG: DoxX family protein [Flavobacterium sp.]
MKKHKIIFWVTTSLIFLFEGVMPALFSQSDEAKQGIRHLGYPDYFGSALVVFKILGCIVLIVPKFPKRIKEWAYAGFGFDFIFASISYFCVEGAVFFAFFPLIWLVILALSYNSYHKLNPETVS